MTNIEQLNIAIKVKEGIEGTIKPYKYNINTDLASKNSGLYTPTKYDLVNNAPKISKLKDVSLYSDITRLEEFLKKTSATKGDQKKNINFILKLLFKKNSKFYINDWQFIVEKPLQDTDISISTSPPLADASLNRMALQDKHRKIREKIEDPYKDLDTVDRAYYEPTIKKQIIETYHSFLTNNAEKEAYIKKYIADHKDKLNQITVTLILKPNQQTAQYLNNKGFDISDKDLPRLRDCKSKKKRVYKEFMNLLCNKKSVADKPVANKPADGTSTLIVPNDTTGTGTNTGGKKSNRYYLKSRKNRHTSRYINGSKRKRTLRQYEKHILGGSKHIKAFIGQPSKDFPFCKAWNKKKEKKEKLTVIALQKIKKPANIPSNITRKTKMFLNKK